MREGGMEGGRGGEVYIISPVVCLKPHEAKGSILSTQAK